MSADRRRHPRIRAENVSVRLPGVSGAWHAVEDISQGGLLVRVDRPVEVGSAIDLDLVRPGWQGALNLRGKVIRAQPSQGNLGGTLVAVCFEDLLPEVERRLAQTLAEHWAMLGSSADAVALRTALQSVLSELGAAREGLRARDRELELLKQENAALLVTQTMLVAEKAALHSQIDSRIDAELREARYQVLEQSIPHSTAKPKPGGGEGA